MTKIYQILGHHDPDQGERVVSNPLLVSDDKVGIEIEVEGIHRRLPEFKHWHVVHDGSLRNGGVELVFNGPKGGLSVIEALNEADEALKAVNGQLNDRTGLHVHVDVRDLEPKQLKTFMLLAIMFEEVFIRATGNRENNIFCCRFAVADAQLKAVSVIDKMKAGGIPEYLRVVEKYASVNMRCMFDMGSIEFRYHKGSYDKIEIRDWVNTLLSMKKFSRDRDINPALLAEMYSMEGGSQLFQEVVGEELYNKYYDDRTDELLHTGMRLAQDAILIGEMANAEEEALKKLVSDEENFINPFVAEFYNNVGLAPRRPRPMRKKKVPFGELPVDIEFE